MVNDEYIKYLKEYSDGVISSADKEKLLALIENDKDLDSFLHDEMENMPDTIDENISLNMFKNIQAQCKPVEKVRSISRFQRFGWVAALIILPLIASILTYFLSTSDVNLVSASPTIINVEKGQRIKVVLPDSTLVWLNSASALVHHNQYNLSDRTVELSGEAYFEVHKNKDLPFIVKTPNFDVKATGTSFNIKAYPEDDNDIVTLISGSVDMITTQAVYNPEPNQQMVYNKQTKTVAGRSELNAELFTLWRSNTIRYNNENMDHVARDIERIFNMDVSFDKENIKSYQFTGSITCTSLDAFLEAVCIVAPIRYEISETKITFYEVPARVKYYNHP